MIVQLNKIAIHKEMNNLNKSFIVIVFNSQKSERIRFTYYIVVTKYTEEVVSLKIVFRSLLSF